jgi:hypothetical protein
VVLRAGNVHYGAQRHPILNSPSPVRWDARSAMNLQFHYVATTTIGFTGMATRSENIADLQRCPHRKIRDDRDVDGSDRY